MNVPIILLGYDEPQTAATNVKQDHFKFWIKLERAEFREIQEQIQKGLREISIWFNDENKNKLLEFLGGV